MNNQPKEKPKKKEEKVTGTPQFENNKLIVPKKKEENPKKVIEKKTEKEKVSKEETLDFEKFLSFCKEHELIVDTTPTASGNTKISNTKRIVFYAHKATKYPIVLWNQISKKQEHVSTVEEAKLLLDLIK
jgi:hypothetical protein